VAHETGVADVADPLGGSYFVEAMTDEMERQAEEIFEKVKEMGDGSMLEGTYLGIEDGWFQGRIADSAYAFERKINDGSRTMVGVNDFTDGDEGGKNILYIGPEVEERQLKRLANARYDRNDAAVTDSLAAITKAAADPTINTMGPILEAVRAYASVGEIIGALEVEFGRWEEQASI
jgi:methylmalonyl-CoA mutase, N-terminal domain